MADNSDPLPEWQRRDLPPLLSRRFDFPGYSETRDFLDAVAKVSEELGIYPNMSFSKTFASVTIDRGGEKIGPEEVALALRIDAIFGGDA